MLFDGPVLSETASWNAFESQIQVPLAADVIARLTACQLIGLFLLCRAVEP